MLVTEWDWGRRGHPTKSTVDLEVKLASWCSYAHRVSRKTVKPVASGGGKIDINKVGLNSVPEGAVKQNLMGRSRFMGKKDWVDSQGRKGKVRGAGGGAWGCMHLTVIVAGFAQRVPYRSNATQWGTLQRL